MQYCCSLHVGRLPDTLLKASQCEGPYKHFCQHHQSIRLQQYYCHQSGPHWQSTYPQQHHQQGRLQHLPKPMNLGSQHKLLCSAATVAVPRQPHSQGPHWRCFHTEQQHQRSQDRQRQQADNAGTQATVGQQQQQRQQRAPGASWTSLPNLLSLSRVVSGPWVAWLIATQQWPLAVGLTALAGVTDWLDGHLARQMGHTSKLGSYLDPLADKILIGSVVGTMGYLGMLPGWLAVVVVGRDAAQVTGMMWYRVKMFGGAWPGAAAFFDVDGTTPAATTATAQTAGSASATTASSTGSQASSKAAAGVGLPQMKPLMVSKLNTVLIFVLVAGCISQEWQGVPGQEVLDILEYSIAGTTAASAVAYVGLYRAGKLLPAAATPVAGPQ
eukprot:GHUV01033032.1.p1 GENE.GHUV01033032.1~~GHUV01033032.1.p1  ORF type:complete len:384 (+),score=103.25 GHUV01033032.1:300-1451(+)